MLLDIKDANVEFLHHFNRVVDCYDAFLVDIWGVLHDGSRVYPGAVNCLEKIKGSGKKILLISNSARQGRDVADELMRLNIPSLLYDRIVTSGDTARSAFIKGEKILKVLGSCYYLLGSERYDFSQGISIRASASLDNADFILNIGVRGNPSSTNEYAAVLQKAVALDMKMVCVNPDLFVVRSGVLGIAPGSVASFYQDLGGRVIYFGKPYQDIYEKCFDFLGRIDKSVVAAVGDAVSTDIAGACKAGIDSFLIGTGIHGKTLEGLPENVVGFAALCRQADCFPTAVLPGFKLEMAG